MPVQAIGGIATVRADGRQFALRGDMVVAPTTSMRAGVAGLDGVHGYTEVKTVPHISGTFSTTADLSMEELNDITSATVQADLVNGKSYVLRDAWCTANLEVNATAGSVAVRFEGISCDEI